MCRQPRQDQWAVRELTPRNPSDRHHDKSPQQAQFRRTVFGAKVGARGCWAARNSGCVRGRQAGGCPWNEGTLLIGNYSLLIFSLFS